MRYFILVLCLFKLQVEASDWLNRTIRVDLRTNFTSLDVQDKFFELSESTLSGVDARNGQYPWSIFTIAWVYAEIAYIGTSCSSSIISQNFALSDSQIIRGSDIVETFPLGARISYPFRRQDAVFMRHYWYIEPSSANSPNIVLLRFHEALTFSPNVQPIRLPAPDNFSYEGWASMSLWFTLAITPEFAEQLQFVNNNIPRNADCTFQSNFPDHEMCSIEQARITGNTPPGGAWVLYEYNEFNYHATLVGIHKSRFTNETSTYGVATRVSHFVEWIGELTAEVEN